MLKYSKITVCSMHNIWISCLHCLVSYVRPDNCLIQFSKKSKDKYYEENFSKNYSKICQLYCKCLYASGIQVEHCGFLVLGNTQKSLTQIWDKNDGENICHWNYFQFPRALSELPANWPDLTSLTGWIGWAS